MRLQKARDTTASLRLEQPPQKMEFVPTPLIHTVQQPLWDFEAHRALAQISGPCMVLPMLTRSPFSFNVSLPEDQFLVYILQQFSDNDQVICIQFFPETSCMKLLREFFQDHDEQYRTQTRTLVNTHFHTELFNWGYNQHALCFSHFHTRSVWPAPASPQRQACQGPTYCRYTIEYLFQIDNGHAQCLVDGMGLFL